MNHHLVDQMQKEARSDRVHKALARMKSAHEVLCRAQQEVLDALDTYDKLGDHDHTGGPRPGDCIRCGLIAQLRGPAQGIPK